MLIVFGFEVNIALSYKTNYVVRILICAVSRYYLAQYTYAIILVTYKR